MSENKGDTAFDKQYLCGYCGYQFRQAVRQVHPYTKYSIGKSQCVSTQVVCPRCRNFLKTWDEGELVHAMKDKR